jgi:hypothetical protein
MQQIGRGWHAAYVVVVFLMAVTEDDKAIRFALTATGIGAAYFLGRKSEKEKSGLRPVAVQQRGTATAQSPSDAE